VTETERRFVLAGARAAAALPAWIVGLSFVGVGSLARDAGHPMGAAILSTVLMYAAPAQLILYTSLADGGIVLAAAIAVAFSAIRLFPMTMSILPYLRRPGQPMAEQFLLAHPVAATIWMEAMRRLPSMEPAGRIPYYAGFALFCTVVCVTFTGLGYALVGALPRPLAAGLIAITPIYFTIAMASGARMLGDWLAIGFGIAFLPAAQWLIGTDFDILAAGLIGGTAAYAIGRTFRTARASADG
jgi:predicted branched-subunit amino acid permease